MILICPVRPGDSNEELRYAARSWEANLDLEGGLELWTVGYQPSWLTPDRHIPGNTYKSVPLAVFDNVHLGALTATQEGAEAVVFMNDDFFCLDPVGKVMPVKRNISLQAQRDQFPRGGGLWWPRSLDLTLSWLADQGYPSPDSYETHRPLPATASGMVDALRRWVDDNGGVLGDTVPQWRTIYGVLNKVDAHPVCDVKLGLSSTGYGSPWISTSDQSWRRYASDIRKRFQKPSRWER